MSITQIIAATRIMAGHRGGKSHSTGGSVSLERILGAEERDKVVPPIYHPPRPKPDHTARRVTLEK